jgi:hypothetical protein
VCCVQLLCSAHRRVSQIYMCVLLHECGCLMCSVLYSCCAQNTYAMHNTHKLPCDCNRQQCLLCVCVSVRAVFTVLLHMCYMHVLTHARCISPLLYNLCALNYTITQQAELTAVLKATGTKRMIVGHTPQVFYWLTTR